MAITLTWSTTTMTLPAALDWADEFAWSPVVQSHTWLLDGSLHVDAATRQAGRPITLQGAADRAWMARADALALQAWAAIPGLQMTLLIDGTAHTVVWDHERTALDVRPLPSMVGVSPDPSDDCVVTLRFLEL